MTTEAMPGQYVTSVFSANTLSDNLPVSTPKAR